MKLTMRAVVLREHGALDQIRYEQAYPQPVPGAGQVLIRVRACALNYHDIFTRRGMPGIKPPLPLIVGSDIAGEVAQCGAEVNGWQLGERVLIDPLPCAENNFRMIGEMFDGGRAEYCVAPASQLIRLQPEVSFEEAAAIPLAYATAHRMMVTQGRVQAGETVLILGASGGVGTACVMLARLLGARVVACAGSEDKLQRLRDLGAEHVINYRQHNVMQAVHEIFGKPRISGSGGLDVVVNYTGGGSWQESIRCLKLGGRLLTCGATAGFAEPIDVRYVWTFELSLCGSNGWRRADISTLLELAARRALVPIVDRVLPLEQAGEAERLLEDRAVFGKIVLAP